MVMALARAAGEVMAVAMAAVMKAETEAETAAAMMMEMAGVAECRRR